MRLFVTDAPQPFLLRRTILIQEEDGVCLDLQEVLSCAGLFETHAWRDKDSRSISKCLSLICNLQPGERERIEKAVSLLTKDRQRNKKAVNVCDPKSLVLQKPTESNSKTIIVGYRNPISSGKHVAGGERMTGFLKFASSLADPGSKIPLPGPDVVFDADAVLGVVIGKRSESISPSDALSCVAGFTLLADVTDRNAFERECRTNNNLLAKNRANLSPFGPTIWLPRDKQLDQTTELTLRLNGQLRQQFTLGDLSYTLQEVISAWSRLILEPGDVIGMGASIAKPQAGKAFESPIPVKPGDTLEVESPPLGLLKAEFTDARG
jgi:2-keto-4-pentenoate hydratase/2-oxohepta-3-ene-1,7-dioic acid hydratase in catechol pathway